MRRRGLTYALNAGSAGWPKGECDLLLGGPVQASIVGYDLACRSKLFWCVLGGELTYIRAGVSLSLLIKVQSLPAGRVMLLVQ